MNTFLITFLVGAAILAVLVVTTHSRLVKMRQQVSQSWSAIETDLRRRFELIPTLIEVVKGYASNEQNAIEDVIQARNAAASSASISDQVASNNALSGALTRLFGLAEFYPDLKADQSFASLQRELLAAEARIAQSRGAYNDNVKQFNSALESFPASLIAGSFGFYCQPFFSAETNRIQEAVHVRE